MANLVKILVSCHKPSYLPKADFYLPIQVGAACAATKLDGMQMDDQGENISDRNFTYSEMSGQYWAWKNLDADYVGQCHYRRFFAFDGKDHPANDHAQIECEQLDQTAVDKFALCDQRAIDDAVRCFDMIVPPTWKVWLAPTPHGPKRTVGNHMIAYDITSKETLDLFMDIVRKRQPQYYKWVKRYVNGGTYRGYNCFIMKRELFDKLCAFEFDVLAEFDRLFDYEGKTPTQRRICGFLGEILFSSFVAWAIHEGYTMTERPLVFFQNTDPNSASIPVFRKIGLVDRIAPVCSRRRKALTLAANVVSRGANLR